MNPLTNRYSNSILGDIYQEACKGAARGAMLGASVVTTAGICELFKVVLEKGEDDSIEENCEVEEFDGGVIEICTQYMTLPFVSSFKSFSIYVIGTSTICGMLAGTIYGVAKNVFIDDYSDD